MERYGEDLAAIHAAGFTEIASAAAAELLPRLLPGSIVLELGCGDGTTARLLSDAGHDVRALDSSPSRACPHHRRSSRRRPVLFDLATPRRAPAVAKQAWTEGEGWAVMVEVSRAGEELRRRIVTFRDRGGGRFRRGEELHRLRLHHPAEVLGELRAAGFAGSTLPGGYAGVPLPRGLVAYLARKR